MKQIATARLFNHGLVGKDLGITSMRKLAREILKESKEGKERARRQGFDAMGKVLDFDIPLQMGSVF